MEGWRIAKRRSVPRVETDDIVDELEVSALYSQDTKGWIVLIIPSSVAEKQKQHQKIKHNEGTGVRGPLAYTSVAPSFASELGKESE